jgi:SAM-dependent methyltransferase
MYTVAEGKSRGVRVGDIIDGFGEAFMAHHRGEPSDHVVERDDGYVTETDALQYFLYYEEWPDHEREAILEAKGRVLDVGLGAGRHALWLQERGHEVVGIDVSPLALEVSRQRGVKDCRLMDMRELDFPDGHFDTVLMLGANLGIGGDVHETRRVLRDLKRITTPDGLIIGHSRDPLKTDNPAHLAYHEMNRRRGEPPGLVRVRIGFQGRFGEWFDLLFIGEEELAEIVETTGWEISKIYGSEDATYVAVLTKEQRG